MGQHLPILPVIVPMICAPLCLLVRRRNPALGLVLVVAWAVFGLSLALLAAVRSDGELIYRLGGWPSPWGIEFRIDMLSAFVMTLVSAMGAVVASYAPRSIVIELDARQAYLFGTAFLLCLAGLMGITATGDAFNLFVFLEISALSTYALISLGAHRRALLASFQYLINGTIGATFILIGVGLLYMITGTLNMSDIAARLGPEIGERTALVAFAFLFVGIALKMAFFPLHFWLPNAYASAPSAVSAFLATTATKVAVYIFLRFVFTIFGAGYAYTQHALDVVLLPLALLGMFVASTVAIMQPDLKRLLAFSSVAQVGYMVLGASFGNLDGLTGGIVHLFNHALTKGALFLAVGCVVARLHSSRIVSLKGLGRRMPLTAGAITVGGLGLIGVPGTAGFVSKWYLVVAAFERGLGWVAFLILLSSLLSVLYVWRVVETMYLTPPDEGETAEKREAPVSLLIPMLALTASTIWFGFHTGWSVSLARAAAKVLLGGPS